VIAAGAAVTVITVDVVQPALTAYVMRVVPGVIPVTTPVNEPIVATAVVPLVHVPPPVLLVNVIVEPGHTVPGPTIGPAADITLTVVVTRQPLTVYEIVAVPNVIPVTTPLVIPIDAIVVGTLVQKPPGVALLNKVVAPIHKEGEPVMGAGKGFTDTVAVE
jgi:hypothetical protein